MMTRFLLICTLLITPSLLWAKGVYQEPSDFVAEQFDQNPPKASVIWLKKDIKKELAEILQHNYSGLRIRYWKDAEQSVWVLNEIGKEKPISIGFVVKEGKITLSRVLIFRESRGWEIRHPFFTNQFTGASLVNDNELDRHIDSISGATLSVRAYKKLSRIALLLDAKIRKAP